MMVEPSFVISSNLDIRFSDPGATVSLLELIREYILKQIQ